MLDFQRLHLRAAFFRSIRSFFERQDFLEVDTPVRQPVLIPEANIAPLEAEGQYLQASPELCMKRILALGCERIFQICPCFRKGELGRLHSEEFLMLEWYRREADYQKLMTDCEELIRWVALRLAPLCEDVFSGLDFEGKWQRLSVAEAFSRYSPIGLEKALAVDSFDELLVEYIEPKLGRGQPLFLYDYPVELGSLARSRRDDCRWAERFELYMNGVEIANGFSELADAQEQRLRFSREIDEIQCQWGRQAVMPERFLAELSGIGDAAGIALGLDRLLMLAMNKSSLAEVRSFGAGDF